MFYNAERPRRSRAHHDGRVAAVHRHASTRRTRSTQAFVDVRACIESSVKAPAWPFAIDMNLAAQGKRCSRRPARSATAPTATGGTYPNQLVPLADVGTDPLLAQGETEFAARFVEWFANSFWGETSRLEPQAGYIAPPLDGIWATAPFFHNGSVPTIEACSIRRKRPTYWTRTFESTDYDPATVGWKFTAARSRPGRRADRRTRARRSTTRR